eukprot:1080219-Rhodomonas_salina.1
MVQRMLLCGTDGTVGACGTLRRAVLPGACGAMCCARTLCTVLSVVAYLVLRTVLRASVSVVLIEACGYGYARRYQGSLRRRRYRTARSRTSRTAHSTASAVVACITVLAVVLGGA